MSIKGKTKPKAIALTVRAPAALLKHLDRAAEESKRSRSAEVLVRLEQSFAVPPAALSTRGAR